jgi:predicted AlkP superfamily phosphohydrolase/phosphomutase
VKILVIGLDCAAPELVFDKYSAALPNLRQLMASGIYGRLESCIPAITIPAWMVMVTGKSPGELGMYGFRHRRGYAYEDMWIANSQTVKESKVWDILGKQGKRVCLVGVPPSYPPYPVAGNLVSCFLTPGADRDYTYPPQLKEEIESLVGEYLFDVVFRTEDRDTFLSQLYLMTEKRFDVIKYLMKNKEWDFFMFVEIGVDRIQHTFWRFFDKEHHLYQPGNRYEVAIPDYYRYIDKKVGQILSLIDNDTAVLVVSDHGAKRMKGAFCINEWLAKEGFLALKSRPQQQVSLEGATIEWSKTKAWGWGGYYARIFLNVEGREPQGVIKPKDYERERDELAQRLKAIKGPNGEIWDTKVFKPEEVFQEDKGDSPDLMVYFDDLYWRAAGTMGHEAIYLPENDIGPDDAVHSQYGLFILYHPQMERFGEIDASIYDITPTILRLMGLNVPQHMRGESILPGLDWGKGNG